MRHSPCSKRLTFAAENWWMRAARSAAVATLVGAACVAGPASGVLYKWTDTNGVVVYSDQPPPGNVKVDTLAGPPPLANPNAARELANKELDQKRQQATAAETAQKAGQQKVDAEKQAAACRDARAELTRLAADQILLYSVNEKGEQVFMNDTERRRRREAAEVFLKANCKQG